MLELEPPRHTRLRGLVLRAFTSRRIAALAPMIEALCNDLDRCLSGRPVRPADGLCPAPAGHRHRPPSRRARGPAPTSSSRGRTRWWRCIRPAATAPPKTRRRPPRRSSPHFCAAIWPSAAPRPADDLLTHLLAAEAEGDRLSEDELVSTVILLLNAGHEATVHTLGNAVRAILLHGAAGSSPARRRRARRGGAALGSAAAPLHPSRLRTGRRSPGTPSGVATRWAAFSPPAGRDPAAFAEPTPLRSDAAASGAPRVRRRASISASARHSRGWSCGSPSPPSSPACPARARRAAALRGCLPLPRPRTPDRDTVMPAGRRRTP